MGDGVKRLMKGNQLDFEWAVFGWVTLGRWCCHKAKVLCSYYGCLRVLCSQWTLSLTNAQCLEAVQTCSARGGGVQNGKGFECGLRSASGSRL